MEDQRLLRIEILLQQKRYSEAEKLLKELLAQNANDTHLLALLGETYLQQDRLQEAEQVVDQAIGSAPDNAYLFFIKSRIKTQQDQFEEAQKQILHAVALDPFNADYFAFLANIKLVRKQYQQALDHANKALEIDPENLLALNMRSTALVKLDKKEEAFQTIQGALREDPDNAFTHANYGWGLLEKGDHRKALEHFKEALRQDPSFSYAQHGLLEALKAGNPVYRLFLKYAFFMGNLTSKYQWAVLIGFYLGFKVLRTVASNNDALKPYLTPLVVVLAILAFSTWVINPISNLFLRFNRYGQLLLSKQEKMSANFVAGSFLLSAAGLVLYFTLHHEGFLALVGFGFAMMLPFSLMFEPARYKHAFLIYAIAMALLGLASVTLAFAGRGLFNGLSVLFLLGFVLFQWVANFLLIEKDNH